MALSRCPSQEALTRFLTKQLSEADTRETVAHLEACGACRAVVETLRAKEGQQHQPEASFWHVLQEELAAQIDAPRTVRVEQVADVQADNRLGPSADQEAGPATRNIRRGAPPTSLGRLDSYQVQKVVGRGGMGVVLRAFDESLQRVVAIKVLAPHLAQNAAARKRFVREARAAAAVSHEHVVTIHAVDDKGPIPYLVMQFLAGESLQDRLESRGPLSVSEIVRIGLQTAEGLAAAHKQGLVHRDIKPGNILLENGAERVKIVDFGLARVADEASLTQSGYIAGTPEYMSPEQAAGEPVDARSDLFSLGSVLYALCTGRSPFRAPSSLAALKRVSDDRPRPIREINPDIPEELCAIIERLHAKGPAQRYQTAAEVAEQLNRLLADLQVRSRTRLPPAPPPRSPQPVPSRRKTLLRSAAALVLLLTAGGFMGYLGWSATSGRYASPGASAPNGANAREPGAAERASSAAPSPIPLLPLVDVARDSVGTEWRLADGTLTSPEAPFARLQLPYRPPAEYDLSLCAERRTGGSAFAIGLVIGGRQALVVLDGWGAAVGGLHLIDGKEVPENATRVEGTQLPLGRPVRIDCTVRANRVTVAVQGTPRIEWQGDPAVLSLRDGHRVPSSECLFVGACSSSFALTDLSVRPLSAPGWRLSDPARSSPARVAAERLLWTHGGALVVAAESGPPIEVDRLSALPVEDFHITTIRARAEANADRLVALLSRELGLRRLELDHTELSDQGAGRLSRLAGLQELSVVGAPLGDAGLAKLAGLADLKHLRVGWAQFTGPALQQFARQCPGCQVQQLSADQTAARTWLALGGRVRVRIGDGGPRVFEKIADLPEAAEFRLLDIGPPHARPVAARHFCCLRNLVELREFSSWYNDIDDNCVRHWQDLPRLEVVHLGTCRLTSAGLEHLSGFPTIRDLNLNSSTCDDAGLVQVGKLARLEVLALAHTAITDASVEVLSKLRQLKHLDVQATKMTPEGADRLQKALPQCQLTYP